MTMTTHVRINHPINPVRVLDWLTEYCGGDPATVRRHESQYREDGDPILLMNAPMQGLDALCAVEYNPDGPLPTRTKYHDDDEPSWPEAIVEATFDSPYSYRSARGERCSGYHKRILMDLAAWLDEQHVPPDASTFGVWEFMSDWAPLTDVATAHPGDER